MRIPRLELPAAGGGERVVARAPIVLGQSPLGGDEAGALEAVERLVERRVLDLEHAVGALVDRARHGVSVHRAPGERAEHEHVEGALEEVHRLCRHASPRTKYGEQGRVRTRGGQAVDGRTGVRRGAESTACSRGHSAARDRVADRARSEEFLCSCVTKRTCAKKF